MHDVRTLLQRLESAYGRHEWWPAESAFEVVVGALLVQRTTWTNAEAAIASLKHRGLLECDTLAEARIAVIERCVRRAGFYRTKAARLREIARYFSGIGGIGGLIHLPTDELRGVLLELPGVGPETADAVVLYAYDRPVWICDAYSRRLFGRLTQQPWHRSDEITYVGPLLEADDSDALKRLHALIVEHGKQRCRKSPRCQGCVLQRRCAFGLQCRAHG